MNASALVDGLVFYVVFVYSTTFHEAAHAWMALRGGDPTAYRGGQVTLDPLPHIRRERVGMVAVPFLSFLSMGFMIGWASAPYNPMWAHRYPRRAALMALAGPLSNLLLLVVAALAIRVGIATGYLHAPSTWSFTQVAAGTEGFAETVAVALSIAFSLNLLLFVFNLVPMPPLDGGAILPLFLDDRRARAYLNLMWRPTTSMVGLIVAWRVFPRVY